MQDDLKTRIHQAIGDPGSVVGRRPGPSWGRGNDGYAREQETLTQWATRAVVATLDQQQALLPGAGRMATFRPGGAGRSSTAVIQLDGCGEILRFMVNLLGRQLDIDRAGRAVLVDLRDHMGFERFDEMARSLLGDTWYEKLRDRFEREWACDSCEKDIRVGARYAPTADAGAVCAACCKGHPEYVARLVKRRPDVPVGAPA